MRYKFTLTKLKGNLFKMKLFRMKHRSLVRIIASIIPEFMWNFFLPVTPRMYISSSVMDKILSLKNNDVQSDDESFSSFKSHLSSNKDAAILYSTPLKYKSKDNSRLRELQRELDEIQKQLTKLMEHQCDQFHSSSYEMINGSTQQRTVWANITIQLAGSIDMVDYNLQIKSANPKYNISSPKHAVLANIHRQLISLINSNVFESALKCKSIIIVI